MSLGLGGLSSLFPTTTTSRRGQKHLVIDNFKFRLRRVLPRGEKMWRCSNNRCYSSVKTVGPLDEIIYANIHHSHSVSEKAPQEIIPHYQDEKEFFGIGFGKMIQLRRPNATEKDAAFKCDECPKFYRSKTSLNLHKRWECGKEPKFACPYCDKRCHQKGNLKVHIISRHRDRINPNESQTGHMSEPSPHMMNDPSNHMSEPTTLMREPST